MSFLGKIKTFSINFYDDFARGRARKNEIRKFENPEREKITSSVDLSDEQKALIDEFYLENYGEKIPYTWHKNFMAHSGKFDEKYFPELLYIPEFERFMNLWPEYARAFSDKNVLPILANNVGIRTPKSIASITKGAIRNSEYELITRADAIYILNNAGKAFIKPTVDSCSGRGCFIADFKDGVDILSGKTVEEIFDSLGSDAVIQSVVKCHRSLRKIYSGSVNTFRVITYRWKDEILHMPVIMRIGQGGSYLDNAHAGGMFIALDDDGTMHKFAMTEFNLHYTEHPDTGVVFEDEKIELLPNVINAAKRMHAAIPQLGVVNWDFTIDEDGEPLLIEANLIGGSVWLPEMAHGCGAFGDKTAEVLQWLRFMKKLKPSQRKKYAFGNF